MYVLTATTTCICSTPIWNLVQFQNRTFLPDSRTGHPVLKPAIYPVREMDKHVSV